MNFTDTELLSEQQKLEIIELWNREYPKELSLPDLTDFDQYLERLSSTSPIALESLSLVKSCVC
jgi:hypothetical protein